MGAPGGHADSRLAMRAYDWAAVRFRLVDRLVIDVFSFLLIFLLPGINARV